MPLEWYLLLSSQFWVFSLIFVILFFTEHLCCWLEPKSLFWMNPSFSVYRGREISTLNDPISWWLCIRSLLLLSIWSILHYKSRNAEASKMRANSNPSSFKGFQPFQIWKTTLNCVPTKSLSLQWLKRWKILQESHGSYEGQVKIHEE